jgi:hypothetical protein
MANAGSRFGGKDITTCCLEEIQHRFVFEGWRICYINDYLSACKRFSQSLTSEDIDSCRRRRCNYLMVMPAEIPDELCSYQSISTKNYNFHFLLLLCSMRLNQIVPLREIN